MINKIYLDLEDNLSQVIRKIKDSEEQEIFLIIPSNNFLWQTDLSFQLLYDKAREFNKKITVITPQPNGLILAKKARFSTATSIEEATARVEEPEQEPAAEAETAEPVEEVSPRESEPETESENTEPEDVESQAEPSISSEVKNDNFGFITGGDIVELLGESEKPAIVEKTETKQNLHIQPELPAFKNKYEERVPQITLKKNLLKKGRPKIYQKFAFWLVVIIILLIGSLSGFMWWYLPKATVEVFVQGDILTQRIDISALPNALEVNAPEKTIPATVLKIEEQGQENGNVTGEKTVGKNAHGTVTIQNWTDSPKTFAVGTTITAVKGQTGADLTFSFNASVTVPAQTFSIPKEGQKLYEAGKAEVAVTATDVGSPSNLSAATNFSISNVDFADFKAVNSTAFQGGESHTVKIVTEADRNKLMETLKTKLYAKGAQELAQQKIGDQKYDEETITNQILSQTFSQEVGAESTGITLALSTQTKVVSYSESQAKLVAVHFLNQNIPEGFKLRTDQVQLTVENVAAEKDGLIISVLGTSSILPQIETESIKRKLLGKKSWEAEIILKNETNVIGYTIELWPKLPRIIQSLPHVPERINIIVKEKDGNSGN